MRCAAGDTDTASGCVCSARVVWRTPGERRRDPGVVLSRAGGAAAPSRRARDRTASAGTLVEGDARCSVAFGRRSPSAAARPRTVTTLDIIVHPTVESFGRATGREWWTSAASRLDAAVDNRPDPARVVTRDGRLEPTLRHELAHVVIDSRLRERPMWVREGLAMHFAGDTPSPIDGPCPVDGELRRPASREAMASSYRRARGCVERALASGVNWRDVGK